MISEASGKIDHDSYAPRYRQKQISPGEGGELSAGAGSQTSRESSAHLRARRLPGVLAVRQSVRWSSGATAMQSGRQ
jgi:hypothetical protein